MAKKRDISDDLQLEEELGRVEVARPTTDVNLVIQLLVGLLGTVAVWLMVLPLKGGKLNYLYGLITERGPVQYIELFMAFMVLALIVMKSGILRKQLRVLTSGLVPKDIILDDEDEVSNLRQDMARKSTMNSSIVANRIDRMLALWLVSKDVGRVSTWAADESERSAGASDSSYSIARVLIWAIPIMGFIGTVMGLGQAIASFSNFLSGSAELGAIKGAIGQVTQGLGVAFDTTLLALVLSVLLMFPLSNVQRREETLLGEVDNYLNDHLISRFPAQAQQPIVIENLEDAIEAAFRRYIPDPDRYDEVFTRAIDRAASSVEDRFNNLASGYESTLNDLTARLSSSMATVGDSLEASLQRIVNDLQNQGESLVVAHQGVAETYKQSATELQEATLKGAEQSLQAAGSLAGKMEEVSRLAENIEDMLKVQESVDKTLQGLSASEDFTKAMSDLREHLATTDQFCAQLSKPRVITLTEEIAS